MGSDREKDLLPLAEAVADGIPVDWEKELKSSPALQAEVRRIQTIEKISSAFHSFQSQEPTVPKERVESDNGEAPLPVRWGHLEIIEKIGQGAFGEVFRAYDSNLDTQVALKLSRPGRGKPSTTLRRFKGEAQKLVRVKHPNVLVVHGVDEHDGRVGIWSDLLEGKNLEDLLADQGTFGAKETAAIGIDLCGALAAVHACGVIHQDVKTSNVMRVSGGNFVLMDFSAASEPRPPEDAISPEPLSGTPLFMAPEMFRGSSPGVRSDIYSAGVVLYRLLAGSFPVEARTAEELTEKHRSGSPVPLMSLRPNLAPPLVQAVEKALDKDPRRRYRSPAEMARALALAVGIPVPDDKEVPWLTRRLGILSLAAAAAMVVGFGILLLLGVLTPFEVEAALFRVGPEVEERLLPGSQLRPNDRLFLEIEGTKPMHVYVLNQDAMGEAWILFPLPNLDQQNPIDSGLRSRLPGMEKGSHRLWQVSNAGGRETLLVIASRKPLEDLERDLESIPRAGSVQALPFENEALDRTLRGIGNVVEVVPEEGYRNQLPETVQNLRNLSVKENGIWVWGIELDNPGP